jgi:hypothetical protein
MQEAKLFSNAVGNKGVWCESLKKKFIEYLKQIHFIQDSHSYPVLSSESPEQLRKLSMVVCVFNESIEVWGENIGGMRQVLVLRFLSLQMC